MTRKTFIDEIQDPVTGETHRVEAPTEAELDAATDRYVATLEGEPPLNEDTAEVQQASSDPADPPVDPQQPINPA